jgi:type II secretory ATPase GspE/PulE/Tfp pilus assembly ATPase PilB-like protein
LIGAKSEQSAPAEEQMPDSVLLRFNDGTANQKILVCPFESADGCIVVTGSEEQTQASYSLSDLCYIKFNKIPATFRHLPEVDDIVEIETICGDAFIVRLTDPADSKGGSFARPAQQADYAGIFFPSHAVHTMNPLQPLEEILPLSFLSAAEELDLTAVEQQRPHRRRAGDRISLETPEEALVDTKIPISSRVGDILITAGLTTRQQIEDALASQAPDKPTRIGELLIEKGLITEDQLLAALATKFKLRFVDLDDIVPDADTLAAVPYEMAVSLNVFPIGSRGRQIVVATSSPTDSTIADTLRFYSNRSVELVVARKDQIKGAIKQYYLRAKASPINDLLVELKSTVITVEEENSEPAAFSESDSQIINLVNRLLIEAHQRDASDIHFEPGPGMQPMSIRYRIDGICRIAHQIAGAHKDAIIARIKIISRLDIAERRRPQSGKILLRYENRKLEYRVEITPTAGGREDAVLRLLSSSKPMPINGMGFSPPNLRAFREMLNSPYGVILCVGPTGSGKTTSLHSALGHINTPERKIWTAEDPVEITQPGLRQVQVHPKIGFSFPEALRSFLRADPDVIMIGEMRDLETARIVIDASLTGHLVFSTLHTNNAAETCCRLLEMGVEPINFAEALLGILAQRLVRRLCPLCKRPYHPDIEEYRQMVEAYGERWFLDHGLPPYEDRLLLMKKVGCEACGHDGYKGRLAVHELLTGTPTIKALLKKAVPAGVITELALTEGLRTLRMDGIYKVFQGETDLEQVLKVCW